ncbi:hypothetical protein [Ottowia sp.]|uniref:hypothetical protein n=1 Tax=Ottowia sp. TaxID=1898956 RepID=UPI003A858B25
MPAALSAQVPRRASTWLPLSVLAGLLLACTPTFNWRELRLPPTTAVALLPCKPDRAERTVPLGGVPTPLVVNGCDTGGATFALMAARLPAGIAPDEVLAAWQRITLANMRSSVEPQRQPFHPPGGLPLAHAQRLSAQGQQADGRAVMAQAVWTARAHAGGGTELLHAVVYAPQPQPEATEAFFAGIKWP